MHVGLMTEGSYPHSPGGVSVWCDQLLRSMPEHDFQVVALVGAQAEKPAWALPPNVSAMHTLPLWGEPPTVRRPGRRHRRDFTPLMGRLALALCEPPGAGNATAFEDLLRDLFAFAQSDDLCSALGAADSGRLLMWSWNMARKADESLPEASVHDVVTALRLVEHALRPLSAAPIVADVSHCVANGLSILPALTAKWVYGTPILLTEHGLYLRESYLAQQAGPYRWPVRRLYLGFLRRLCEVAYAASAVVAPGNLYNRRWEERLGADPDRIRTVYNGVDPADFPPQLDEPEQPTISWAGRIDPIKDLQTLIRAFEIVHRRTPDARLRLFGGETRVGAAYRQDCIRLRDHLGLTEAVTFEGRVKDIRTAYAAGHVVVLSSISEGFPYTVIEAMISGRACVATDVGGVGEAVGDTGLMVPAQNPQRMADACTRLLTDHELRRRLGRAARDRALALFTVDRATGAFDEMYESISVGRTEIDPPCGGAHPAARATDGLAAALT